MKQGTSFAVITMLAIGISAQCIAQPEPGKLPPPPPGQEMRRQALQQVMAFSGQAGEFTTNDDYVYDGFYLQTAQAKYLVKFPPHLGTQCTKAIKAGAAITVNGVEQINPDGEKEIRMISVTASGQTINDAPPAAAPEPPIDTQVSGSGKITAFQKNREGEINGYVVDGKTILRLPPHVITQLNSLVTNGAAISFTGMKKAANTNGEASAGNYSIVHCQTITVNGTQYLTR